MLLPLKSWLTVASLFCLSLVWAEGPVGRMGSRHTCGIACGRQTSQHSPTGGGHAQSDPCGECCACGSTCFASSLATPDAFWILFSDSRWAPASDWRAVGRSYPPPLPPPRAPGVEIEGKQVT
jgi:hypothetical protein